MCGQTFRWLGWERDENLQSGYDLAVSLMSTLWLWWIILYYPIIFAVMFGAKRVTDRYPENSPQRARADLALGCAVLGMPSAPLIVGAVWFVYNTWSHPIIRWIEAYVALMFAFAFFHGAMINSPWFREIVAKIRRPFSRK